MTDVTSPEAAVPVRRVGRYEVLREVGRGGMAVVHLARQTDLDRLVALKELAAFRASDPAALERFLLESRLAGSLNHPNVVTVHEYFEHEGTPYIAMEYFERGSLRGLVDRLTPAQTGRVLEEVLAGLAHAETRGIVHRDLKPENVMVTAEGNVKITDFGLARALQATEAALTTTSTAVGTPAYMAPEQALGKDVGPWTDVYAVGVIAYELLSGHVPFHGTALPLAMVLRHLREPVPPLRSVAPETDARLAGWVERLLRKNGRDRPTGAAEAWEELEEILIAVLGPQWRRGSRLLDGELSEPRSPRPAPPAGRVRRRRLAMFASAAVLLAVGATAAVVLATGGGGLAKDALPPAQEQISVALAEPDLYVADPHGRLVELGSASLLDRRGPGSIRPRVVGGSGIRVYVGDASALHVLRRGAQERVLPVAGATAITGGDGAPVVVSTRNRLCELTANGAQPVCLPLGFRPTGLGVSPTGLVFAADDNGYVQVFQASAGRLLPESPVAVGRHPHGILVAARGRLYVPVERGVAVVSPLGRARLLRTIHLPVSPAAIWVSPITGKLFAALYAVDRVAILDTLSADPGTKLLAGYAKPVAVWGAEGVAYVVSAGDGTVCRLDAQTGDRLRAPACRVVLPHA